MESDSEDRYNGKDVQMQDIGVTPRSTQISHPDRARRRIRTTGTAGTLWQGQSSCEYRSPGNIYSRQCSRQEYPLDTVKKSDELMATKEESCILIQRLEKVFKGMLWPKMKENENLW